MQQVMTMDKDYEAMQVLLQDGDYDLELTIFTKITVAPTSETEEVAVSFVGPKVMFSSRLVTILQYD